MEKLNEDQIKEEIIKRLKVIYDPEIPVNIYDLGLIYSISLEYKNHMYNCHIVMTLTTPACPVAEALLDQVKYASESLDQVYETYVELTFSPEWNKKMITDEGKEILELSGMII